MKYKKWKVRELERIEQYRLAGTRWSEIALVLDQPKENLKAIYGYYKRKEQKAPTHYQWEFEKIRERAC